MREGSIASRMPFSGTNSAPATLSGRTRADFSMKFVVEVVRTGESGRAEILHRVEADEISPKWVKVRADQLLTFWRGRGATAARVLNVRGEELYVAR
jgi:streptomycin 6-kinase